MSEFVSRADPVLNASLISANLAAQAIVLADNGRTLLKLHRDGTVEGSVEDASEAGRVFVESVRRHWMPAPLTATMTRSLPGGVIDDTTFSAIEDALDQAGAPMTEDKRWLTLPERVAGLAAEHAAMLAMLRQCAEGHAQHGDLLDLIAKVEI